MRSLATQVHDLAPRHSKLLTSPSAVIWVRPGEVYEICP